MTIDSNKLRAHARRNDKEEASLKAQQDEAKVAGATLRNGGFGGLSPSLAHAVMKRDKYKCTRCGDQNQIGVHHSGGIGDSDKAALGKRSILENLTTLCHTCHSEIHEEADARGASAE